MKIKYPRIDAASVLGWGVDANPDNDPTYPIRHIDDQERGPSTERPMLQQSDVEILESIEYDRRPAVIGTSTPPTWASGAMRRLAFKRSESDWWHWLLLMGADRVNVVEGVIQDLSTGRIPNVPAEMGARAAWRHNKPSLFNKAVGLSLLITTFIIARNIRAARADDLLDDGNAKLQSGGIDTITERAA